MEVYALIIVTFSLLTNLLVLHRLKAVDNRIIDPGVLVFENLDTEAPQESKLQERCTSTETELTESVSNDSHSPWRNQKDITHVITAPGQHNPLPPSEPLARPYGFPG